MLDQRQTSAPLNTRAPHNRGKPHTELGLMSKNLALIIYVDAEPSTLNGSNTIRCRDAIMPREANIATPIAPSDKGNISYLLLL